MAVTSPARLRDDLAVLMHQGKNVQNSSYDAARLLARTVKFDGFCMLTVDPATLLPTGEVVEKRAAASGAGTLGRNRDVRHRLQLVTSRPSSPRPTA